MTDLAFVVYGTPAPQGSKRHVGNGVMVESSKRVQPWRQDVKHAALRAIDEHPSSHPAAGYTHTGPVAFNATFYLARPKSHFRTGANAHLLRDNAPTVPAKKPDIDKLLRSTLDALGEAGVWVDDAQVVEVLMRKEFADTRPPGAYISVRGTA